MTEVRVGAEPASSSDGSLLRLLQAFPGLRVTVEPGPFELDYRRIATDRFSINRMRCVGRMRAVGPLPEAVTVGRRTAGEVAIRSSGGAVDTSRPYLRPTASSEFAVRDGAVLLVALRPAAVTEYMERSGERGRFGTRLETAPQLAAWSLVMDHAGAFLDDPDPLDPDEADELHDLLCWSLLHAFEDPWAETGRSGARSAALRRALSHMEDHAHEAVTMPEVAEAARVSVRSLGLLFRRELDTTPLRWLRDLRLDRARLDLLHARGTVAEVAARNGMPHPGRFAAQYRDRFEEHPGTTLRGTGGRPLRPRPGLPTP